MTQLRAVQSPGAKIEKESIMQDQEKQRKIKGRTIVSLLCAWSFLTLGITGLVLYIEPHGRIAFWSEWRFLGLGKENWDGLHIISGILFVIAGAFHIWYNWKPLIGHIRIKLTKGIRLRMELVLSLALAVFISVSALWHIPPIGYLLDLNEYIKGSWVQRAEDAPPYGHAEMHSLKSFCEKTRIDLDQALKKLKEMKVVVTSSEEEIRSIAKKNKLRPADLYFMLKEFQRPGKMRNRRGGHRGAGRNRRNR